MTTEINPTDNEPFHMPIEEMHALDIGLMMVGRTQRDGQLHEGDTVAIIGLDRTIQARVDGIDIRGDSMALRFHDLRQEDLEVGMVITNEGV